MAQAPQQIAKIPINRAPIPTWSVASHPPEMMAKNPKTKAIILAHSF